MPLRPLNREQGILDIGQPKGNADHCCLKKVPGICFLNRYFRYVFVFTLILGCDATRIVTLPASKPL